MEKAIPGGMRRQPRFGGAYTHTEWDSSATEEKSELSDALAQVDTAVDRSVGVSEGQP